VIGADVAGNESVADLIGIAGNGEVNRVGRIDEPVRKEPRALEMIVERPAMGVGEAPAQLRGKVVGREPFQQSLEGEVTKRVLVLVEIGVLEIAAAVNLIDAEAEQ
jgi:hypothetical protein